MALTRHSLLYRVQNSLNTTSWEEFVEIYSPVITATARRSGLREDLVDDILQEVLMQMVRTISHFQKDPSKGTFRSYLARVTTNKIKDYWRKPTNRAMQLKEPTAIATSVNAAEIWEEEVNRQVFHIALERVREQSQSRTWKSFEAHVLQKQKAADVAETLGITENAVFVNCSRTLARIRELAQTLKREDHAVKQ